MSAPEEELCKSAYHVGAWHADGVEHGPQCSATGEFCFLCAFRETADENDVCSDLKAMVRIMVGQKKELPVIVDSVHSYYEENLREEVTYKNAQGIVETSPAWSKHSIQTHLVFSTEFEGLFNNLVTQMHQSIIMHLNAKMLRPDNTVSEDTRKALVDTVASLQRWQRGIKR